MKNVETTNQKYSWKKNDQSKHKDQSARIMK